MKMKTNKLEDKLCPYYTERPTCSNQGLLLASTVTVGKCTLLKLVKSYFY